MKLRRREARESTASPWPPPARAAPDPDSLPGSQVWRGLQLAGWHQNGAFFGRSASEEQAVLVLGPPRSGKTSAIVIPNVWMAPGAVVSTSTKDDVLQATVASRLTVGTCYVFDPTGSIPRPPGTEELRWSPLVGSETADGSVAMARALVQAARPQAAAHPESQHWIDRAEALLAPLFLAAAASGRNIADVCRWVLSHDVREPEAILAALGAQMAKVSLSSVWRTEERERSGIFSTAAGLLAVYRTQSALEPACQPNFDPARFAASQDTLYICAPGHAQELLAPLVVALLDQIRAACYARRRSHPDAAPTLFLLDEAANIAPLPGLPQLASEGGGQGVVTLACLQDLSQARARWGTLADGFFSLFGLKVVFPGIADHWTLELISSLMGEEQIPVQSISQPVRPAPIFTFLDSMLNKGGSAADWRPTVTTSTLFRRRMPVEDIYRGYQGHIFAFDAGWADYLPVEPWWSLQADIERQLWIRRHWTSGPEDEWHWPESQWHTLGPRVVGRNKTGFSVTVPGTACPPTPRNPAQMIDVDIPNLEHLAAAGNAQRIDGSAAQPAPVRSGDARAMPAMHGFKVLVRVMGPPDLVGELEPPERDKAIELACILSMHWNRPMSSEELRAGLWPGDIGEPGVTAKSLMNTASILRRAIGPEHFPEARRGTGYELGPCVGFDWRVFCELAEAAREPEEKETLRTALALVRGPPFQGVRAGTYTWAWTEHLVSAIEAGIRKVAYRFCELSLSEGDPESAVWAALQALAVDPYDLTLWEWYLKASAFSGRRALDQAWKEATTLLLEESRGLQQLMSQLHREAK